MYFDQVDLLESQDGNSADAEQPATPLKGLTNSQRRAAVSRRMLLSRFAARSSEDLNSVLSGLTSFEAQIDQALSDLAVKAGRDGVLVDEQTTSDLLKIAGACSAMRQHVLIIADTISDFNNEMQGA